MEETKKSSVTFDPSLPMPVPVSPEEIDVADIFKPEKKSPKKKASNVKDARKLFKARKKWPHACLQCGGDGAIFTNDEDDVDDEELDIDLCEGCLKHGKCPRCATPLPKGWKQMIEEVSEPPVKCTNCKWEDGDEPVLPYPDEE